jgi:hypothetical protein
MHVPRTKRISFVVGSSVAAYLLYALGVSFLSGAVLAAIAGVVVSEIVALIALGLAYVQFVRRHDAAVLKRTIGDQP